MEHVWICNFTSLFQSFGHQWYIIPVEDKPISSTITSFVDSAKVRFSCDKCGHGWTSMKGRVVFWFDLYFNHHGIPQGIAAFKLFGQKCEKCKMGSYEIPMWYPEEVFKVSFWPLLFELYTNWLKFRQSFSGWYN